MSRHLVHAQELPARIAEWVQEDPCFATLLLFIDPRRALPNHWMDCRRCHRNVEIAISEATDPLKRLFYRKTLRYFVIEWLRQNGCVYEEESRPNGFHYRAHFPPEARLPALPPFTSIEGFRPSNRSAKCHVIYGVRSEDIFEDPRPLIQHLDVTSTTEVKAYPASLGRLHWNALFGEKGAPVLIRWAGRTKEIASDPTLYGRYRSLLAARKMSSSTKEIDAEGMVRPSGSLPEDVLWLRDAVLRYDGRAWFAGYLKQLREFRKKDALRRLKREERRYAGAMDPGESEAGVRQEVDNKSREAWVEESARKERLQLLGQLLPRLAPMQAGVFRLKLRGLTDAEVGSCLGIRRETVNRHLSKIRKLAAGLR